MAFAESGGIITQTGTDTDLSGLTGVSGVTTTSVNGRAIYQITNKRLIINGTLTMDPELEELFFDGYGNVIVVSVNTGTFNIGQEINIGATKNRFSSGTAIRFDRNSDSNFKETSSDLYIDTGGTLNWYGGAIFSQRQFSIYGTFSSFSKEAKWIGQSTLEHQIRQRSTNTNINGFVSKGALFALITNASSISNYESYDIAFGSAISPSTSSPSDTFMTLTAFDATGVSGQVAAFWKVKWLRFINYSTGSDIDIRGLSDNSSDNLGLTEIRQELTINLSDINSTSITDAKIYMADTDNSNRLSANQVSSNPSYLTDRTYTGTSTGGSVTFDTDGGILVAVHWRTVGGLRDSNNNIDYRCLSGDTTDDFSFKAISYTENLTSLNYILKGSGTATRDATLLPDTLITQSTKATVDAYTTIDDAYELYDRAKSYLYDNFAGEEDTIVSRTGNQIDLADIDLVIDAIDASVYSNGGSTITIKSSTFTGGATATTGTVTTTNGTLLSGGTFDCDISYDSGASTTITDITCTGAIDFTTAGTYTLDGGTINEVTNSSGGAVVINIINGATVTTNTGPSITINNIKDVSITGIVNGSRLQIYNVTTASEFYNGVPGTSLVTTYNEGVDFTAGDTVRIRVAYQSGVTAYSEFEVTTLATSSGISALITQTLDAVYNEYGVDGSLVTEFSYDSPNLEIDINDADNTTVIQRIGAWYHAEITTAVGIDELFGCLDWETLNSIKVSPSVCAILLDNTKATPLLVRGGRIYNDDGSTIIASTSESIQLDFEPVYVTSADPDNIADLVWNDTTARPNGSKGQRLDEIPRIIARNDDL